MPALVDLRYLGGNVAGAVERVVIGWAEQPRLVGAQFHQVRSWSSRYGENMTLRSLPLLPCGVQAGAVGHSQRDPVLQPGCDIESPTTSSTLVTTWSLRGSLKSYRIESSHKLESDWRWIIAAYLLTTSSKGVSSLKLASLLELQYRTTWHLIITHRIRAMMADAPDLLRGLVERDETYIGGKGRKRNRPQPPAPLPLFEGPGRPKPQNQPSVASADADLTRLWRSRRELADHHVFDHVPTQQAPLPRRFWRMLLF